MPVSQRVENIVFRFDTLAEPLVKTSPARSGDAQAA